MLQDLIRTSSYETAITANGPALFKDKLVVDVGAGSGILSYFAVKAGAAKVYAIEASGMALKIKKMVDAASTRNTFLKGKIDVIHSKVEDVTNIPQVDAIISEPIGVLLLHERMVESFIYARDAFLKPYGTMLPSTGTIFLAPFTDSNLWAQTMGKVRFWEQTDFYGVDFSPLRKDAVNEVFGHPAVGLFDHRILMAPSISHHVDFRTCTIEGLKDILIPISWTPQYTGIVHGIAGWFDIDLGGFILSTAPNAKPTHWQQVRFLLKEPLAVNAFETITGWFRMKINQQRSYDISVELTVGFQHACSDPYANHVSSDDEDVLPDIELDLRNRRGRWALQEQVYSYVNEVYGADYSKPEMMSLYPPMNGGNELDSLGLLNAAPVVFGQATNI
ncbi:Histone-arginine methyltransferase carm1 [Physocladia obscura]|uniref:type I protein arginine methyltransferase n=1 Tax=Physocladia obscura TaxID=109957 RepID=A0AAD5T884_9FUNG|nr:Histone-arginine methyltransferase carm1 [Physocladia obscura]